VACHRGENVLRQYDLNLLTIPDIINNAVSLIKAVGTSLGALQLGPDSRIYVAQENGFLGVINNPNAKGAACNYIQNGQFLNGKISSLGLPGFISSILTTNQINYKGVCAGSPTAFSLLIDDINSIDSVHWDFGDSTSISNNSTIPNPEHIYQKAGLYTITVFVRYDSSVTITDTLYTSVEIKTTPFNGVNVMYTGNNPICGDSAYLSASRFADGYQWYKDGVMISNGNTMSVWATQNGKYSLQSTFLNSCSTTSIDSLNLVFITPPIPVIENQSGVLITTQSFKSYQWYLDGQLLQGENNRTLTTTTSGTYTVKVTDSFGCTGQSN
jgi:hypothetical protein